MFNFTDLYNRVLTECFNTQITSPNNTIKQLRYQTDAVNQAVEIINSYDGVLISDVVGLGKTYVALMIIQKMITSNTKVLIVIPPALETAWLNSIDNFSDIKGNLTIVSNAMLNKVKPIYDFIIVDESHNFRNSNTARYKALIKLTYSKKVILMSATPIQNRLTDLYNQLMLFTAPTISKITGSSLDYYFKMLQSSINKTLSDTNISETEKNETLEIIFARLRNEILSKIMVRRTRKNLTSIPQYSQDLQSQGIIFPEIKSPITIKYEYDFSLLLDGTLNAIQNKISFANYNIFKYLTTDARNKIESENKIKIENISNAIDTLFKTILLKRLDSSIESFRITLTNIKGKIQSAIKSFDNNSIMIDSDIENVSIKSAIAKSDLISTYRLDLESDLDLIGSLLLQWNEIKTDSKIQALKDLLETLSDKKVVIFSESVDTINYVQQALNNDKILKITSENRKSMSDVIKTEFDANSTTQTNNYSVLLTSDTLAEGVNLHRASVVINFDITWNPTRVIQRIGRIDRIGSTNSVLYVYNFLSNTIINSKLYLNEITNSKMQLFNNLLGNDNVVLSENETINTFDFFDLNSSEYDTELQIRNDIENLTPCQIETVKQINFNVTIESQKMINKRNQIHSEYTQWWQENEKLIIRTLSQTLQTQSIDDTISRKIKDFEYQLAIHSISSVGIYKSDDNELYIGIKHNLNKKNLITGKNMCSNLFEIKDVIFITPKDFIDLMTDFDDFTICYDTNKAIDNDMIKDTILGKIRSYNYTLENKVRSSRNSDILYHMYVMLRQESANISSEMYDVIYAFIDTLKIGLDSKVLSNIRKSVAIHSHLSFVEYMYEIAKDYPIIKSNLKSENITQVMTISF